MALEPESARLWRAHAQFDYVGPFVKAWAAFNAWFRDQCGSWKDADGIKYICSEDNIVRNTALPRIRGTNDQAMDFKRHIETLHKFLEAYDLNKRQSDGSLEAIKFTSVCIQKWHGTPARYESRKLHYKVGKTHGQWVSTIRNEKTGKETFRFEQDEWDIGLLEQSKRFKSLTGNKPANLRQTYIRANPTPIVNLLANDGGPIEVGDTEFQCTSEELFSGLIMVIYNMRNCMLHGELSPNERALVCYEPAFWILKDFLDFADA